MTNLKCVAIDDEPLALNLLENYISRFPYLHLLSTFEDAVSGAEYLKNNHADVLFLDINMPDISGIDLVRSLATKPIIIFTTAYKNFAFEGFELEALDYLLKPIDISRFTRAVEKALDYYNYKNKLGPKTAEESFYVYSEYRMVKINVAEIAYLESMEDYIKIHLSGEPKPVLTLMSLKKALEKLPADRFKRIHRSYIIAINKVKSIHNRKLKLGEMELPIGESYTESIRTWAKNF